MKLSPALLARLQSSGRIKGDPPSDKPKKSKYRNRKTEVDGITFDSAKEATRYQALKLLERAGQIQDLRLQVSFDLCESVVLDGKKQLPVRYVADFCYLENGKLVTEDVKGMKTQDYRNKRKLMKAVHNIEIKET